MRSEYNKCPGQIELLSRCLPMLDDALDHLHREMPLEALKDLSTFAYATKVSPVHYDPKATASDKAGLTLVTHRANRAADKVDKLLRESVVPPFVSIDYTDVRVELMGLQADFLNMALDATVNCVCPDCLKD